MQIPYEAPHALITGVEAADVHEVLPNGHGVAAPREPDFDRVAVRRAGAGRWTAAGFRLGRNGCAGGQLRAKVGGHHVGRFCAGRMVVACRERFPAVGDHLYGRFYRRSPPPVAGWPQYDSGLFQVARSGLTAHTDGSLNSSKRPSQPPQRYDLLFLFVVQDIAHNHGGYRPRVEINVLNAAYLWPVFR